MNLIDSHFHLTSLAAGWLPSSDLSAGLAVTSQASEWHLAALTRLTLSANWRLAVGVHPWYVCSDIDWLDFEQLLSEDSSFAIGEIGLDGSYGTPPKGLQFEVFQRQLSIAQSYGRLLSLHLVNDQEQGYQLIRSLKGLSGGIVHGFIGSLIQAKRWQALGFHLGLGPVLLTQLTDKRKEMLRNVNIEMIHLESDAPFRNRFCQLASPNDLFPYQRILASVLDVSEELLSEQLANNWQQLWSLQKG